MVFDTDIHFSMKGSCALLGDTDRGGNFWLQWGLVERAQSKRVGGSYHCADGAVGRKDFVTINFSPVSNVKTSSPPLRRLQGIRYPRPPPLDPADELFLFKRHSRGQERMANTFGTVESGSFPTSTRRSSRTSTLPWSELSALKQEASLVGPTLWSGLTTLQYLISLHESVSLESEARILPIDEEALPRDANPSCHKLLVQLDSHDEDTKPGLRSAMGRYAVVEEKVVDDFQYSPLKGNDDFTARDGAPYTVGMGMENGQVGEEIEHPDPLFLTRTCDDPECLLDTNRGHRTNKTGNPSIIREDDKASTSLSTSLLSSPDELKIKSSGREALPHYIDASRAEDSDNAICPDEGESQMLPAAEGGGGQTTVDKVDKPDSAFDRNRISAGQSQICTLSSHSHCQDDPAPSGDRCSNREREGRANTVDTPARSGNVLAKEDVQIREARHELSMETSSGCGAKQGVKLAALERGIEEGHKLEAKVEDRLRELQESEMALLR